MNVITFKYTKADGTTSRRVMFPLVTPNKMYEGIDISELDDEADQVEFILEMSKARDAYLAAIAVLESKYDVANRYRRFDPAKMTDVVQESI